jgi:hypothetical protein
MAQHILWRPEPPYILKISKKNRNVFHSSRGRTSTAINYIILLFTIFLQHKLVKQNTSFATDAFQNLIEGLFLLCKKPNLENSKLGVRI